MMQQTTTIFFGPPGTGKTATLLACVKDEIARGVSPEKIAYVAFTRRAAAEARARGRAELGLGDEEMSWWRTLHSTAARELGVHGQLVVGKHWDTLGEVLGMKFGDLDESGRPMSISQSIGQRAQSDHYLRRARLSSMSHDELVQDLGAERAYHASRFGKTLNGYKQHFGLLDYADLLDEAPGSIGAEVILLDEAQDLTPQQWAYFNRLRHGAKRVYVAGDDEQAIFEWAGATVDRFLQLEGARRVLVESHRLPKAAYQVARTVSDQIRVKVPKTWRSSGREGSVERYADFNQFNLSSGTWLLLARTRMALDSLEQVCRRASIRYLIGEKDSVKIAEVEAIRRWERARRGEELSDESRAVLIALAGKHAPGNDAPIWHEALTRIPLARRQYYEGILRTHGKNELFNAPRVRVDTIHGAKGAEADHVALLPDLTPRVYRGLLETPDAEHRVWYVAVTRCKDTLHIATPQSNLYYGKV